MSSLYLVPSTLTVMRIGSPVVGAGCRSYRRACYFCPSRTTPGRVTLLPLPANTTPEVPFALYLRMQNDHSVADRESYFALRDIRYRPTTSRSTWVVNRRPRWRRIDIAARHPAGDPSRDRPASPEKGRITGRGDSCRPLPGFRQGFAAGWREPRTAALRGASKDPYSLP